MNNPNRYFSSFLGLGALLHLLTDALCCFTLFNLYSSNNHTPKNIFIYFAVYTFLAFATQFIWGYFSDKYKLEKVIISAGSLLIFFAVLATNINTEICIIMLGLGNSFIHVGAGSKILQAYPNRFAPIGIFVAPGAIGVTLGTLAGKFGIQQFWLLGFLLLAVCFVFLSLWPKNNTPTNNSTDVFNKKPGLLYVAILISVVIAVRSYIGSNIIFPWKTDLTLLWLLTFFIAAGKVLGGITADKYGWLKVGVLGLLISIPGIIFFVNIPWAGLGAILLFNLTMPITLFLLYKLIPDRPAFSFGISCLALYMGFVPVYFLPATNQFVLTLLIAMSALSLYFAYKLYFKK